MWIDDEMLWRAREKIAVATWVPKENMVVLGSSNKESVEVYSEGCQQLGIPVLKRYGGGGTVLLYPGCFVVSVGLWVKDLYQNQRYFQRLNSSVIQSLASRWPIFADLGQKGLSDIVMGDKKVAGTSMFRSRNYLLYQASVIVHLDVDLLAQCLRHPSKEPDYRSGRSHRDFLVGLQDIEPMVTPELAVAQMEQSLVDKLTSNFGQELLDPFPQQIPHLEKRARS